MKKGLILEGGAMRGMFTAGVVDIFLENNIDFDGCVGVSAGAAFGCNIKSRQIGRAIRYNMKYCRDKRYCGFSSLVKTGDLYGADFCYRELPEELDLFDEETFINNPMDFYACCTDIETGLPYYKLIDATEENYFEWFRASASMPLVSRIVEIGDKKLLDGGVSDSVPLKFFEELGYDRNVVVLTQPKDYIKKKNSMMPLMRVKYKNYPNLVKAIETRHEVYNETIKYICEKEKKGEIIVIRPESSLPVSRTEKDPDKLYRAYELGKIAALEKLLEIKKFLES